MKRAAIAQSVWRWATGWTIGVLRFDSRRGLGIFLFTTASRTALEPTQPPIQLVRGALSLVVKRPGREADHSPSSSAEVKEWVEIYLHSPNMPSWRGAQLKHRENFTFYLYLLEFNYRIIRVCELQVDNLFCSAYVSCLQYDNAHESSQQICPTKSSEKTYWQHFVIADSDIYIACDISWEIR
jgi:hypothetical protein